MGSAGCSPSERTVASAPGSPSAWVSFSVNAGSGAVLAVDWVAVSLCSSPARGRCPSWWPSWWRRAAVLVAGLLWVGAEAAVTVVVVEPQAASRAVQAIASRAAAGTRRERRVIAPMVFAARCA